MPTWIKLPRSCAYVTSDGTRVQVGADGPSHTAAVITIEAAQRGFSHNAELIGMLYKSPAGMRALLRGIHDDLRSSEGGAT